MALPRRFHSLTVFLSFVFYLHAPFSSAIVRETLYINYAPTVEQVTEWSNRPHPPQILIHLHDPSALELQPIADLKNFTRLQLEIGRAPAPDTVPIWKEIAKLGAELILLDDYGFPLENEIQVLNEIGFRSQLHVLSRYPSPEESRLLSLIESPVRITFRTRAYPRFVDRPGLEAIPAIIPLYFINDYWPGYIHMDVLNFLPNPKAFRIIDTMPAVDTLPYLKNIRGLTEVAFQTINDSLAPGTWELLEPLAIHWIASGFTPSASALAEFFQGAPGERRRLTVDQDQLTPDEQAHLEALPTLIDWIHTP